MPVSAAKWNEGQCCLLQKRDHLVDRCVFEGYILLTFKGKKAIKKMLGPNMTFFMFNAVVMLLIGCIGSTKLLRLIQAQFTTALSLVGD